MRRRNLMVCLVAVFAVVLGVASTEPVRAAGYWNMPGTFAQRAGHGYGGGYHAPWILGPVRYDGWGLGAPVRLSCAPSPYCGCESGGECGRIVEAPSSMEGVVPTTVPTLMPMPAAMAPMETRTLEPEPVVEPVRPLFDAPVQR
jgi:hypothetical protein